MKKLEDLIKFAYQVKKLNEFRFNEAFLLRFLQAKNFDLKEAISMLDKTILWR